MVILKKSYVVLMPVLFAIYSALAFYTYNAEVVVFSQLTWILIAVVILGAGCTGLFFVIFRDWSKASLVATCWLVIILSYGQVYSVVHKSLGAYFGRNVILLPIALILMILSVIWIGKLVRNPSNLILFFGGMVAILYVMTFYSLGRYFISINQNNSSAKINNPTGQVAASVPGNPGSGPDIYYIILDAHGRQDILKELYGDDNSKFIQFLKVNGFFVGDSSHSNYDQTELSLPSSLNMQYLDTIGLPAGIDSTAGRKWLDNKIQDSLVREILLEQGYKLVLFNTDPRSVSPDIAVLFNFDSTPKAVAAQKMMGPTEVEQSFLQSTMGIVILELGWFPKITKNQQLYYYHYLQTQYDFEALSNVPSLPGKYFVFLHVLAPHPPFVFNSDGSFRNNPLPFSGEDGSDYPGTTQEYIAGYRNQVEYVDFEMEKVITNILANSKVPPIIIIQGDHGPGAYLDWSSMEKSNLDERMSILNAYYFPGGHSSSLYSSITPVNSFRILFDTYFNMNYPRLPDKSYFSTWGNPFNFIDVTSKLKK